MWEQSNWEQGNLDLRFLEDRDMGTWGLWGSICSAADDIFVKRGIITEEEKSPAVMTAFVGVVTNDNTRTSWVRLPVSWPGVVGQITSAFGRPSSICSSLIMSSKSVCPFLSMSLGSICLPGIRLFVHLRSANELQVFFPAGCRLVCSSVCLYMPANERAPSPSLLQLSVHPSIPLSVACPTVWPSEMPSELWVALHADLCPTSGGIWLIWFICRRPPVYPTRSLICPPLFCDLTSRMSVGFGSVCLSVCLVLSLDLSLARCCHLQGFPMTAIACWSDA